MHIQSLVTVGVFKGEWDTPVSNLCLYWLMAYEGEWWHRAMGLVGFDSGPAGLHVVQKPSQPLWRLLEYNLCFVLWWWLFLLSSEPTVPSAQTVSGVWEDKATNASTANCWCTRSAINWSQWSVAGRWSRWGLQQMSYSLTWWRKVDC